MWGAAAHCPEVNKKARLVERKVCFISDASNREGRVDICPKADSHPPPPPDKEKARAFIG